MILSSSARTEMARISQEIRPSAAWTTSSTTRFSHANEAPTVSSSGRQLALASGTPRAVRRYLQTGPLHAVLRVVDALMCRREGAGGRAVVTLSSFVTRSAGIRRFDHRTVVANQAVDPPPLLLPAIDGAVSVK